MALPRLNESNYWQSSASSQPLVVWHLHRHPDQEVWCLAAKVGHLFALTVCRDTGHPTRPMPERFSDIVSIVQHADQLKQGFLDRGWREPKLREPDSGAYGPLALVQSHSSAERDDPTWADYYRLEAYSVARCTGTHQGRAS